MLPVDFQWPWVLVLLPLALLPWRRLRADTLNFPAVAWLPDDRAGALLSRLWQVLGMLTIASLVVAVAGPGRSETRVERIGRGAEISILMDRSSSMDATIRLDAPIPGQPMPPTRSKNEVVRAALLALLKERPENRYALTLFNSAALRVAPFTDDVALVQAGLSASGIGRGPADTDMGLALLAAIEAFNERRYTGSRAILLVSDGGARLKDDVQRRIREGLEKYRVSLYFIYIQSGPNSPKLTTVGAQTDTEVEEIALHRFFATLGVEYQVFEADDPESMAAAIDAIDAQQNLPLTYAERVPRVDYRAAVVGFALLGSALLAGLSLLRAGGWR